MTEGVKPFSVKKRLAYLVACVIIFIVGIPLIAFYASGYRLAKDFTWVKTGGIFIRAEQGAALSLNDKDEHALGTFGSSFFVQDLRPGVYEVSVTKEGFVPWRKTIAVYEGLVSESSSFLFPKDVILEEVETPPLELRELFSTPVESDRPIDPSVEESLHYTAVKDDVGIWHDNGIVYAKWLRGRRAIPSAFCIYTVCRTAFPVFAGEGTIQTIDFYPGRNDVVLVAVSGTLFAAEVDKTPIQHRYSLYSSKNPIDFRVDPETGTLYIKDGMQFKEIRL